MKGSVAVNQAVGGREEPEPEQNPLEVPADREDKKTADEELSFNDRDESNEQDAHQDMFNYSSHGPQMEQIQTTQRNQ